ncbi:2-oxo acid dehydrogenase subunit E2 [Desulfitobacterium chlororespirans]|uniref:2-oxoacid dehydrogenases acyltransferase (Catalytic domain) n=1 Tax=Desulfitobacterium chlororespirans DSM 11544 TaxID=1121395 RepID=A0A1M7UZB8_9FIRM|nr:2-oxo acid dehydrogenase subunit E2 [Desulfitobacterium chlororespirans]SHN88381.1 2-oxoacid dehydrogenases acyltransferase (catalytic domain) [Desulfitobacterium chlororespirans DSM 11544]
MRRSDGRLLKSLSPFVRIIPHIMTKRSDAQNFYKQVVAVDKIDQYIKEKKDQGIRLNYLHLFIAVYVRVLAQRPQLNRFVMNNEIYTRYDIRISMAIKRLLKDDGEETTVKFLFSGLESIEEIVKIVDQTIEEGCATGATNEVDAIAQRIMSLPNSQVKLLVGTLKWMDRHNLLPKKIIEASPFHTSLFFTYLKSINLDFIYHHLYDFGTTGIFVALGKSKKLPVVEEDQVVVKKCCEIGYVLDERICDGLYYSNSFKLVKKYLANPYLLDERLEKVEEDVN